MEPRTDGRNQIIAGIIIVAIILIGIAYFFSKSSPEIPLSNTATSSVTSESASSTSGTIHVTASNASSSGYTITPIYATGAAPIAPNYKTPLLFSDPTVTADEQTSMQTQFAQVEAAIAKSPEDFNSWIELGDLRKQAGDYAGAAADWQYMSELYPTNVVSNANLGDLYTNYLHEYPQAAAALKAQIANYPSDTYIYDDLFQLYTDQYPQSPAVITAMLKAGIAANPGAAELKADLAKYQ